MRHGFLINGVIELFGGIVLYLYPHLIFNSPYDLNIKMYGLLASCFGLISIFFWQSYEESKLFRKSYLVLMFFHAALAMICNGFPEEILRLKTEATVCHGLIFVVLFIFYMNDQKANRGVKLQ